MDIQIIPIDDVDLDYSNPRIARFLEIYGGEITAERIALALNASTETQEGDTYTTYYSLRESIRINGGIIQPILVNKQPDGRKVVIEGNTRLQIYREFVKQKVPGSWDRIPAIIHENLPAFRIDAIRLQSHMVGPRPWDPYSKAKYLNHLSNTKQMTIDQIIECCGGRRRQVIEYIGAYNDMETFYRPALSSADVFDATRFSAFVELQKPTIKMAVLEGGHDLTDFSKWVIDGLISPLNTVRALPRILSNAKSKEIFLKEGAEAAIQSLQVESDIPSLNGVSLAQLATEMLNRLANIAFPVVQKMKESPKDACRESLVDLRDSLENLVAFITEGQDA